MIKNNFNIEEAKEKVKALISKDLEVTVNLGRNKIISFYGKLSGVYPALFTVSPNDKGFKGKTSYSYGEYLCGNVILKERRQN